MSVYKRGDTWQSQLVIDGRRYRKSLGITTGKQDARNLEAVWRTEILKGEAGIGKSKAFTVRELGVKFLNYAPTHVKPRSFRLYSQAWQKIDAFGPLATSRLNKVDGDLVNRFAQSLLQDGKAVISVNNVLRTLRRALFLAFEWQLINREPRKIVKLLPNEHQRDFVLSETDESSIVEASKGAMRSIIPFAVDTGLRIGEICRLTWNDVEYSGVNGSAVAVAVHVREGKTKHAKRRVPVTKRVAAILEQLKAIAKDDVPYVFTRHNGRHSVSEVHVTCLFKKTVRECKVSEDCVFHSLRHTACTRWAKAGASPYVIQKLAGHGNIQISARYTHSDAEQLEAAVARMGK